jgi:hypothetical protein
VKPSRLTCLILDAPYPRWNSRSKPAPNGCRFLQQLYRRSFDASWLGDGFLFADELELEPRHEARRVVHPIGPRFGLIASG